MVSRAKLERFALRGMDIATRRRVRVVAQVLLALALIFAATRLRSTWHDSSQQLYGVAWQWLFGALVLGLCATVWSSLVWLEILRRLGARPRAWWAAIFLQAQLAKYVPGSIWHYAGRGVLARDRGLPLRAVGVSLPVELAASLCGALAFVVLLAGWPGLIGVAAAIGLLAAVARRRHGATGAVPSAAVLYAAAWPLIGASFWMTAHAFVDVPADDLAVYTGAFAAAWIVGLVAVYAPGGLGVREAVLVVLLRGRLGSADALLVATASRGVFTVVDLIAAGAGAVALKRFGARVPYDDATAN